MVLEALIVERRDEAEGIVSLRLAAADGGDLPPFEAGAHVDVHIAQGLTRPYSLCSDPRQLDCYMLGILQEPVSRGGSAAIHADFRPGRTIKISLPRNNFRLQEDAAHSILAGGGIGITPLMAMAWRLHALEASFELHYCTRTLPRMAFRDLLARMPFSNRVQLHLDDGPAEQRFSAANVLVSPASGRHLYACGPAGFMAHVTGEATKLGWDGHQVHVEHFSATAPNGGGAFTVRAARSGKSFDVPADKSLAEVLLSNGIEIPLSCEQGVCGTCLISVLEGVPDHRDLCLSPEEQGSNRQMTPCCSRAKTPLLVLDL